MDTKKIILYVLLGVIVLMPYLGLAYLVRWYDRKVSEIRNAAFILVDKEKMQLSLIDYSGKQLRKYEMACGKNYGNKQQRGDMKTPEGIFHISNIEKADDWSHDFGDGKGEIQGAYGPWFIRLDTPGFKGIGIHGTHDPASIGTRATEGCIRLKNEDIAELKMLVHIGMVVVVTPSSQDVL